MPFLSNSRLNQLLLTNIAIIIAKKKPHYAAFLVHLGLPPKVASPPAYTLIVALEQTRRIEPAASGFLDFLVKTINKTGHRELRTIIGRF